MDKDLRHVLISNDDGVFAPGLRALTDAFLANGWRVTVAAPDRERSAASHSITIKQPVVAARREWDGVPQGAPLCVWALDATPADCVKVALHALCQGRPDLVASGINDGWNVGTDVHYSGTVGAAMEGAFEGVPGLAVSTKLPHAERYQHATGKLVSEALAERYRYAAGLAVQCADRLMAHPLPMPSVLNLNTPDFAPEEVRGLAEAQMANIRYTDAYDRMEHGNGRSAYWIKGEIIEESCTPGSDLAMLVAGYATVTALGWDLTMRGACGSLLQDV